MTTPQITVPGTPPNPLAPQPTFRATFYQHLLELVAAFEDANEVATFINGKAVEADQSAGDSKTDADRAEAAAVTASGAANYQGDYNAGTFYAIGESVTYAGSQFVKKTDAPAGTTPVDGADWLEAIVTLSGILTQILTVDGAGSGLDADLLDGQEASAFATAAQGAKADTALQPADLNGYALESYVTSAIADLVNSSPATLDTLNELAAALGDDPNFATTVSTQIGTKLDASAYTASDVLTKLLTVDGTGSGLDADLLDGQEATAFAQHDDVETADLNAQTGTTYTLVIGDRGQVVTMDNVNTNAVIIPTNDTAAFDIGSVVTVIRLGAGVTTVSGAAGVTVNGTSGGSVEISAQYQGVSLLKIATDTWIASGAI